MTWHRLSQGSSSAGLTCAPNLFSAIFRVVGETAGAGTSLGMARLCWHCTTATLAQHQDHGSQPPDLSGEVAVTGGQQRDVTGQGWDTESIAGGKNALLLY